MSQTITTPTVNIKLTYQVWNDMASNLPDDRERTQIIAHLEELAKQLLDAGKGVLTTWEMFSLDEYIDGYLSDEDYQKYCED